MTDDRRAAELAAEVGNPLDLWESLKDRIKGDTIRRFVDAEEDWLRLMWSLDRFRTASVAPPGVDDVDALNRGKGNWFAELIALLLQNTTAQHVGSRTKVHGFSQLHQIDVAWPARREDPLICAETKVTGGPAYAERPARGAMSDWTNRRKELKFAATDLKLYRRQQNTAIEHWNVWREAAPPKTYFLWAARLRSVGEARPPDVVDRMVAEAQALINTYLDGAGIFAWRRGEDRYEAVPLPLAARVTDLDDVLYRIATEIRQLAPAGVPPPPQVPDQRAVEAEALEAGAD